MTEDLENTYLQLTYIRDEDYWQKFIYKTEYLESPADQVDCSFICKNVENHMSCDLFVFEVCKLWKLNVISSLLNLVSNS